MIARKKNAAPGLRKLISPQLRPLDRKAARTWLDDLESAAKEAGVGRQFKTVMRDESLAGFLGGVLDLSGFLRRVMLGDAPFLLELLVGDPAVLADEITKRAREAWRDPETAPTVLRQSRNRIALIVALADLGAVWDLDRCVTVLTGFADAAIECAASLALRQLHDEGVVRLIDPERPQERSGWIILALGKLGGRELNYSSDVDLIVLFDPKSPIILDEERIGKTYVRLTQALVQTLQEHTEDGYVLRTDLRLRPDPRSTAVAISVPAALQYYEALGQNWERAALIKARPVAGDFSAADAFLKDLAPFIWRRYLDYAAIADIHSIKRQIHDHRGHESIAVAGHNLKLGRGGIREIEFFVQTQQLIAGGRNPKLRGRRTLEMLDALAEEGWVTKKAAAELASSYRTLRTFEHRLQMVGDEQTHTIPDDPDALKQTARICGFKTVPGFEKTLRPVMETTQRHYSKLFEEAPTLSAAFGNLVFTGDEDDPETLHTLRAMGFSDPATVSGLVRGWHFGRYNATRSTTARERLTEVTPPLLEALAKSGGDSAVVAFDRVLERMPAGVQLFSILSSNPALLGLLATILGTAPRMADIVTRRPHVLDAMLEPAFFGGVPSQDLLSEHLRQTMDQAKSYEEALDRVRIFGQEQAFLIGARILAGALDARRAGYAFTTLADLLAAEALRLASDNIAEGHGHIAGGRTALIAMGKLGGREMTAASDLDLILIYEFAKNAQGSDGERPLSGGPYFTRLTQRLVSALSAPTAEGTLYEVDFRLRPSGNAGPLAVRLDTFVAYQSTDAWTWEHMALTRARLIAGDARLVRTAEAAIGQVLLQKRNKAKLVADILEMRNLVEEEKEARGPWDIKLAPGGLMDVEFIAQYLQLLHASKHPQVLHTETEAALAAANDAGLLSRAHAEILLPALRLYQALVQIIRLCVEEPFDPEEAPEGMRALLARAAEMPDFATLEAHLLETEESVRSIFVEMIGDPEAS